jgi:hypothetical protein
MHRVLTFALLAATTLATTDAAMAQPVTLSENQMDKVTAGTAVGRASFTQTMTQGEAVQNQFSRGFSESVAAANRPARTD